MSSLFKSLPNAPTASLGDVLAWAQKLMQALTLFNNANLEAVVLFSGFVLPWPDAAIKDDSWYFLEGQTLKIATDQGLHKVYGTAFNTGGEGSDEFSLPSPAAPYAGHKWMVKR